MKQKFKRSFIFTTMISSLLYPAHNIKTFNFRIMFQFLDYVIGTKKKVD